MTTGNKTFGSRILTSTPTGNVWVCNDYGNKTWSGGDRPKTPKPTVVKSHFYSDGTPKRFKLKVRFPDGKVRERTYRNPVPPRSPRAKLAGTEVPHYWNMRKYRTSNSICQVINTYVSTGQIQSHTYYGENQSGLFPANFSAGATEADVRAKAIDALRQKIVGSDFDLGVFLGTANQSFNLIASAVSGVSRAFNHAKRGRFEQAAKVLRDVNLQHGRRLKGVNPAAHAAAKVEMKKSSRALSHALKTKDAVKADIALSNGWLGLQYGWLPLLCDTKAAAEALAERDGKAGNYVKEYRASSWDGRPPGYAPPAPFVLGDGGRKISVRIIARLTSVSQATLFGITNPASLIWERLPWSFVFDWFIPIGDYLQRLNFVRAITGEYIVTTRTHIYRTGGNATWISGGIRTSITGASYSYEDVTFKREVLSSLSVPLPNVKGLSQIASFRRALNAIALATQQVRK